MNVDEYEKSNRFIVTTEAIVDGNKINQIGAN